MKIHFKQLNNHSVNIFLTKTEVLNDNPNLRYKKIVYRAYIEVYDVEKYPFELIKVIKEKILYGDNKGLYLHRKHKEPFYKWNDKTIYKNIF